MFAFFWKAMRGEYSHKSIQRFLIFDEILGGSAENEGENYEILLTKSEEKQVEKQVRSRILPEFFANFPLTSRSIQAASRQHSGIGTSSGGRCMRPDAPFLASSCARPAGRSPRQVGRADRVAKTAP